MNNAARKTDPESVDHTRAFEPRDIPQLAPEVAQMIADTALQTLDDWLDHIGAPYAAKTLIDAIGTYSKYDGQCNPQRRPDMNFESEFLPMALNAIAEMGGEWSTGQTSTLARPMPDLVNKSAEEKAFQSARNETGTPAQRAMVKRLDDEFEAHQARKGKSK